MRRRGAERGHRRWTGGAPLKLSRGSPEPCGTPRAGGAMTIRAPCSDGRTPRNPPRPCGGSAACRRQPAWHAASGRESIPAAPLNSSIVADRRSQGLPIALQVVARRVLPRLVARVRRHALAGRTTVLPLPWARQINMSGCPYYPASWSLRSQRLVRPG